MMRKSAMQACNFSSDQQISVLPFKFEKYCTKSLEFVISSFFGDEVTDTCLAMGLHFPLEIHIRTEEVEFVPLFVSRQKEKSSVFAK